ncbi:MAG TPA: pyridoxamine 5'-phosphate oxidase family protein [Spirochaetota bacterium]|nr:pyridoxamine 5'-phosphate oxidase family protein [Spirochaetota bacterium]
MNSLSKTIEYLFKETDVFFISSVDENGYPHTKAMLAPRRRDGIGKIFFTSAHSSRKAVQYLRNPKANLYLCDRKSFKGLMLLGEMEVSDDPMLKKALWKSGDELFHPGGISDPDYCVLIFTPRSGRFYHDISSDDFTIKDGKPETRVL